MATSTKVIYVPCRFNLLTKDGADAPKLEEARALLEAEQKAGARIWIDDPMLVTGPRGDFLFRRWLAETNIPYFGIGGCADLSITHMMVKGKLVPVLDG